MSVSNDFAKLVGGVGKVFVGEIVEMAKKVQREENEARVSQQIRYKEELLNYENNTKDNKDSNKTIEKPQAPSFYDTLLQAETGSSLVNIRRRVDTYDSFHIVIPKEDSQLTPDHIQEAWRRLSLSMGRWRSNNTRSSGLF